MSRASAVAFRERFAHDDVLKSRIRAMQTRDGVEQFVPRNLGYAFTRETMRR